MLFPLVLSEACRASNAQEHAWLLTEQHPVWICPPHYWSQILWLLLLWYISSLLHLLQAAAGGLQLHTSFIKDQNVHVADGVNNNNCVSNSANGHGLPFIHLKCLKTSSSTNHPFFRQLSGVVWLMSGIPAGILMMKQNLNCSTSWIHYSTASSLLAVEQEQLWSKVLNCAYRSSPLTMLAHLMWAQKLVPKFCFKIKSISSPFYVLQRKPWKWMETFKCNLLQVKVTSWFRNKLFHFHPFFTVLLFLWPI